MDAEQLFETTMNPTKRVLVQVKVSDAEKADAIFNKLMGAVGISLTLLALWGGGATVQVGPRYAAPGYIGLDWFVLDLMLSAMIFIFLEKLWPHLREQAILRPDWWHDSRYFLLNHLLIGVYAFAATICRRPYRHCRGRCSSSWRSCWPTSSSMRSTARCTRSSSCGRSTRCTIRSSTWIGSPARGCISWNRW